MKIFCILLLSAALNAPLIAQTDSAPQPRPEGQGRGAGFGRGGPGGGRGGFFARGIGGQITEIGSNTLSLKTEDGNSVKVTFTDMTRFMSGRNQAKATDFKVGDDVMVSGTKGTDGTWAANFVVNRTEQMKEYREGIGKQFIAGEVKAIADTKLTIARPDGQTQVIEVDETTSFRRGKDESITLADIKVGDHVNGRGQMKDGVFVPSNLQVGGMMTGGPGGRRGGPPPSANTSTAPANQ